MVTMIEKVEREWRAKVGLLGKTLCRSLGWGFFILTLHGMDEVEDCQGMVESACIFLYSRGA